MALLETINGAITTVKAVKAVLEGVKAGEERLKAAEVNNLLADVLSTLAESKVDVSQLTVENEELKRKLKVKSTEGFTEQNGVYRKVGVKAFVFCPHCIHKDGTESVLLSIFGGQFRDTPGWLCQTCKSAYPR